MSGVKTPSSIKWLITKRARLVGEIKKVIVARDTDFEQLAKEMADLNRRRGECEASSNQILAILHADLNAVDATIRLHEISICTT